MWSIIQNIAKGMVVRKALGGSSGGGKDGLENISSKDYLSELVAEKVSLDEYMRSTKVSKKAKTPSYATKSVSPEGGLMAYQRHVERMKAGS